MNTKYMYLIGVLVLFLLGIGGYALMNQKYNDLSESAITTPEGVVCTMEAKQCPDGSYVGRQGPNCEFAACTTPITATSTTNATTTDSRLMSRTRINEDLQVYDVHVMPLEVVEDSRCPSDVQCIQAGTVKVRTQVTENNTAKEYTLTLGKAVKTTHSTVTLTAVFPEKLSKVALTPGDYQFVLSVVRD